MDGDMKTYIIAVGDRYTYFISKHYNYIENDKIEECTLLGLLDTERSSLNNTNINLDPFAYHLEKCGEDIFKQM